MTPKQQAFVREYLIDLNATQAAIRAGYSAKTAGKIGQENLIKPEIAAALQTAFAARSERTQIDADWLLTRLAQEAEADVADLYDDAGGLRPVHDWPMIWRKGLVAGLDVSEEKDDKGNKVGEIVKIKLSDRVKRLELIGRHVGVQAFKDRIESSLSKETVDLITAGMTAKEAADRYREELG